MSLTSEGAGTVRERCAECKEEVIRSDKVMECDLCGKRVHIKCGKVTNAMHSELKKATSGGISQGIKFFCTSCDNIFDRIKVDIKPLIEKQIELEKQQGKMMQGLEDAKKEISVVKESLNKIIDDKNKEGNKTEVNDCIKTLKQDLEDSKREISAVKGSVYLMMDEKKKEENKTEAKVAEELVGLKLQLGELKTKYSDVVRVNGMEGAIVVNSHQATTLEAIKSDVSEFMEREKRKNNLVIFGVDETNDENTTRNKISDLVNVIGVDASKVKYFGRVGRITSSNKARVVRVVCEDAEVRRSMLKGSNKLRNEQGYERIYVSPDLTKSQQEQDKILRDNLKNIRLQHKEAKISNGEIILLESGIRKVLYPRQEN